MESAHRWRTQRPVFEAGKVSGTIHWHHHDNEDEMFLVVKGRFRMEFRGQQNEPATETKEIWLEQGEFCIVPRGIEHRPVAEDECHVLLFEPATTLNTGNVQNEFTVPVLGTI